jgi:hypothetical protein
MKRIGITTFLALQLIAQNPVLRQGSSPAGDVDFSSASTTKPVRTGGALPGGCAANELFILTNVGLHQCVKGKFAAVGNGGTWGTVGGAIAAQKDLWIALQDRQPALKGSQAQYVRGDGSLGSLASDAVNVFDVSGAAASAQASSVQRGQNLSDLVNTVAARSNLGLAQVAASGSASDLTGGTVPAARLPASVLQKNDSSIASTEQPNLGASVLANGDFSSGLTGWATEGDGTGWSVANGKLTHSNPSSNNALAQSINVMSNTPYVLGIAHPAGTAGNMEIQLGSATTGVFPMLAVVDGAGYYLDGILFIAPWTGTLPFKIIPSGGNDVSLANITLRPILSGAYAAYSYKNSTGSVASELRYFGISNMAEGVNNLRINTTGANNVAIGSHGLYSNTTGYDNTAVGVSALYNNTTGTWNTAMGTNALYSNTMGFYNTAFGEGALQNNTIGANNTAFGPSALFSNGSGFNNTATGLQALLSNTTGNSNTASGVNALQMNTVGSLNSAYGLSALAANVTGTNNVVAGVETMALNVSGSYNTATGARALNANVSGSGNTVTGFESGKNATGSNNVFLGFRAGRDETGSNKLYIASSETATPLIGGDFGGQTVTINGSLRVTSPSPSAILGFMPENATNKGANNGYAGLDAAGKYPWTGLSSVPSSFIPSIHASTHTSAGVDPLVLAESQTTGLTADLAAKLSSSSTLDPARLGLSSGAVSLASSNNSIDVRNGTNPQNIYIYNKYTDALNWERLTVGFDSFNSAYLYTERLGTGVARTLYLGTGGSAQWKVSTAGHFMAVTDNSVDIGAVGTNRPSHVYFGTMAQGPTISLTATPPATAVITCATLQLSMDAGNLYLCGPTGSKRFAGTTF